MNQVSPRDRVYYAAQEALDEGEDAYELLAAVQEAIDDHRRAAEVDELESTVNNESPDLEKKPGGAS